MTSPPAVHNIAHDPPQPPCEPLCRPNIVLWNHVALLPMTLCRKEPDLELEGLLKRHSTTVKFFQGSMMNAVDLARVKVVAHEQHLAQWIACSSSSSSSSPFFIHIPLYIVIYLVLLFALIIPLSLSLSLSLSFTFFFRYFSSSVLTVGYFFIFGVDC